RMTGIRQCRDELGGAHCSAEAFDDGSLNASRCRATITQCDQVDVFGQPHVRKMYPSQGRTPEAVNIIFHRYRERPKHMGNDMVTSNLRFSDTELLRRVDCLVLVQHA